MIPQNDSTDLPVEEAEAEEVVAKLIWPQQDVQQLLENIHTHMPANDTAKYSTTAKKLNWDDIKFGEYKADDCKSQWDLILTRIRRYRTLGEVVGDAKDWAKNPYNNVTAKKVRHPDLPKKPLSPFLRYFMEKRARFAKKNPDSTSVVEMAKALAASYRELSEKKKARYKQAFDQEYEEYKVKMEEFRKLHPEVELGNHVKGETKQNYPGPVRPKNPFQMFLYKKTKDRIDSKDPEDVDFSRKDNLEQIRKVWQNLSDKKRLKWIKKSIADEKRYLEELEEYKKAHPDFEPPVIKLLNKAEKDLKQRYDGKPEKPPGSGYAAFSKIMLKSKTDCAAKDKMAAIAMEWKELPQEEKNRYNQEAAEKQKEYAEKMEVYLASLPADEREQFIVEEKYKSPSEKSKSKTKDPFGSKDVSIEDLAKDPSVSTAAQCYYQAERLVTLQAKSLNKSQAELITQINGEWSEMPLEKREKYFRMVESLTMPKKPVVRKKSERFEGLEEKEIEDIKRLEKQMPRVPPKNPYSIFLTEKLAQLSNFEPKKRMAEVSRLWKSVLTPKEKQKYEVKVSELQEIYDKELQSFLKGLTLKEKAIYEKHIKKPEASSSGKRKRSSKAKNVTTAKHESSDDEKADSDDEDEEEEEKEEEEAAAEEEEEEEDEDDDDDDEEEEEEDEEEEDDDDDSDEDSSDDENVEPIKKKSRS